MDNNAYYAAIAGNTLGGMYNAYNQGQTSDKYYDILRQQEQAMWEQGRANDAAYRDWAARSQAASNAARASSAAARARTEAAAQKAKNKANKFLNKEFKQLRPYFQSYMDASQTLMPLATENARQGMGNLSMLSQYVNNPVNTQVLNQSRTNASNMPLAPLPDYLRK